MSNQLREEAQWKIGKTPILAKFSEDREKLYAVIAGRGFSALPGFAYDAANNLELAAKMGLSELNYKILVDTVERELKQSGLDYDIAYKTAAIAWELEKQDLLAAWETEYAAIKNNMAHDEEVLNQLMIEVRARGAYLIEQKTAIEVQAEALKKTLAELDGTTAGYEVTLANAKLATAQKKLTLIPILLQIIEKEEDLLDAEKEKNSEYAKLVEAEQEVADKKKTSLVPVMGALVNVSEEYTDELTKQIALEGQIQDEKVEQAGIAEEIAGLKTDIAEIEVDIEEEGLDLLAQKELLLDAKNDTEESVGENQLADIRELQDEETTANADMLEDEKAAHDYALDMKRTISDTENQTKKTSSTTLDDKAKGGNR